MSDTDLELWREVLGYLRLHHPDICRHWFEYLEPLSLKNGVLHIRADSPIQQNYLAKRCADQFREAVQSATSALVSVNFLGVDDSVEQEQPVTIGAGVASVADAGSTAVVERKTRSVSAIPNFDSEGDEVVLSPDYSFENFVTGPGNNLAHAAAVAVAEKPGKAYNPLFIHGGVGLGKTHLLQAVCQQILATDRTARICYLSCESFTSQFLECVQNGQMNRFRHRYRHTDVLVIDDIHFLTNRERTQEEFFHTFNALYQSKRQIVLSSDSPPNEIPQLEERLVSRFRWGLVARIDKPCYETRVAILKTKAQIRGLTIPGEAINYIASKVDTNTRELEGAILKVQSLAALRGEAIDLQLTQEAIGEDTAVSGPTQLSIQNIIDVVINYYGVKLADLQSKRRQQSITLPRHVCMYLARKRTRYSLEEIGGYFGGRDHSTVLHGIKKTEDRMLIEPEFAAQIEQIDQKLATS